MVLAPFGIGRDELRENNQGIIRQEEENVVSMNTFLKKKKVFLTNKQTSFEVGLSRLWLTSCKGTNFMRNH
jgi:hypothetical protein